MMFAMQNEQAEQFSHGPSKFITCRQPILSHNGETCAKTPLTANEDSFCWFRDDGACMHSEEDVCSAPASGSYLRVCACAENVPVTSTTSSTSSTLRTTSSTTTTTSRSA